MFQDKTALRDIFYSDPTLQRILEGVTGQREYHIKHSKVGKINKNFQNM